LSRELTQHIREDAAITVIFDFLRRIHADIDLEGLLPGADGRGAAASIQRAGDAFDGEGLLAREAEGGGVLTGFEL
jgi:hypothetical protein